MTTLKLENSDSVGDIHICLSGDIYYNDSANKQFLNLKDTTKKAITYTGDVSTVYDEGFITIDNGTAQQHSFE